jgi:hypothetical protein
MPGGTCAIETSPPATRSGFDIDGVENAALESAIAASKMRGNSRAGVAT